VVHPAIAAFEVMDICTFRPKEVTRKLKELDWGEATTVKKCGVQESAEKIRAQVRFVKKGSSDPSHVLFVVGVAQKKYAAFCRRVRLE
jgi:hypothetical protein